jgi:hypothetical protein
MSGLRGGGPGAAGLSSSAGPAADNPKEQEHGPGGLRGDEGPHKAGAVRAGRQGQEEEAEAGGGRRGGLQQVGLLLRRLEQRGQEVDGKIEHEEDGEPAHQAHGGVQHGATGRTAPYQPGEDRSTTRGERAPGQDDGQHCGEPEAPPRDARQPGGVAAAGGLRGGGRDRLGAAPRQGEEERVDARMGQRQGGRGDAPCAGGREVQQQHHQAGHGLLKAEHAPLG